MNPLGVKTSRGPRGTLVGDEGGLEGFCDAFSMGGSLF